MEEKTVKSYEVSFLVRNEEDAAAVVKKLSDHGAEIFNEGSLSQLRLAYPIEKEESAYFGYMHFKATPDAVKGLSGSLKLESKIIRFLIITPPLEKTFARRPDFRRPAERSEAPTLESKTEPLSNAQLEERLEEISK